MLSDADRLAAVEQATTAVARRDHGLRGIVQLAADSLGVDYGFLTLLDGRQERFTAVGGRRGGSLPPTLPAQESVCQNLVLRNAPLVVPDLHAHPSLSLLQEVRDLGLRSYAGMPVRDASGLVLGGLCVAHGDVRAWSPADTALLHGLATAASGELELLVALQELDGRRHKDRRRAREQEMLRHVAVSVARAADLSDVLADLARELATLLGARTVQLLRFDEHGGTAVLGRSGDDPGPSALVDEVRRAGRTVTDEQEAVVPVRVAGRTWGALAVVVPDAPDAVDHLEQLADVVSLVVVNAETRQQLEAAARTDVLTGAANRRAFDEQLTAELARVDRHGQPLLLALLDVDHFKQINDEHGHQVGDHVLVALASRIRDQLRAGDLLARVGGDEWALLLPGTGLPEGRSVLERVLRSVTGAPLAGVPVTLTAGLAGTGPGTRTAADLYRAADRALYAAKQRGRDRIGEASEEPDGALGRPPPALDTRAGDAEPAAGGLY